MLKKSLILLILLISISSKIALAKSSISTTVGSIFVGLGKTDVNEKRYFTPIYGINAFTEIHENFRINYGVLGSYWNGYLFSLPLSISFLPSGNYGADIRPQFYVGFEPFYSNMKELNGLKFYGFAGFGVDYNIGNNYYINPSFKIYLNNSFAVKEKPVLTDLNSFSTSFSLSAGYKF